MSGAAYPEDSNTGHHALSLDPLIIPQIAGCPFGEAGRGGGGGGAKVQNPTTGSILVRISYTFGAAAKTPERHVETSDLPPCSRSHTHIMDLG